MSDAVAPMDIINHVPPWVPKETFSYLAHTEGGKSLRALARDAGVHASTILRQVRNIEARREDVLVDHFLQRLGERVHSSTMDDTRETRSQTIGVNGSDLSKEQLKREARRILGHLADPNAVLAVVTDMEKSVIVKETPDGDTTRLATLDRTVAEALAFNGWIACDVPGKVLKYRITSAGRSVLGKFLAQAEMTALGMADGGSETGQRSQMNSDSDLPRYSRATCVETPLALLARRRDKDGKLFLSPELVAVGDRVHEDFVSSGLTSRQEETWDQFLTRAQDTPASVPQSLRAQDRLVGALRDLGPGLGDAVLRCCCCLEGLELTEKRMGWSARSGKIVLRIALQRLKRHYAALGEEGALVG